MDDRGEHDSEFGRDDYEKLRMGKHQKIIQRILGGRSDNNLQFEELRSLLIRLGFEERIKGSHHVFRRVGVEDKVNIQRDGHLTKAYQVRQVRRVLLEYNLVEIDD